MGRTAAVAVALALAALGLSGCGDADAASRDSSGADSASAAQGDRGGATSAPRDSGRSEAPSSGSDASGAPGGAETDGEPLPDDWPEQYLVPGGTIVFVLPMGSGYSVLVEGVDSDQAKGLIDRMAASGLSTDAGVVDMGGGDWTAGVSGAGYSATYAYAGGGAGEPNVTINLARAG